MKNPFPKHLKKEYIKSLPLIFFEKFIHVINTEEESFKAVQQLQKFKVLGFDTEKKPTFNKGEYNHTALVQLSTLTDAYLFRLNLMGYSQSLFDLMANPSILKLGISIDDDLKSLKQVKKFQPQNFTDLNNITQTLGIKDIGVKKLTAIILENRISKKQQISNWEAPLLTNAQLKYAATDAWVCLAIYNHLLENNYI